MGLVRIWESKLGCVTPMARDSSAYLCPLLHFCAFIGLLVLLQECLADLSPRAAPSLCTLARRLRRVAEEIAESGPQQALRSVPITLACRPGEVEPTAEHSRREKHPQISRG